MVYPEKWEEVLELVKAFTPWDPATTEQAIQELVNLGEVAVPSLLNLYTDYLSQGFPVVPELIVEVLRRIGKPAVRVLLTFHENCELSLRNDPARLLGELGDEEAIEPLSTTFETTKMGHIGRTCAEALGKLGEKGLEVLLKLSYIEDTERRAWAALGLGQAAQLSAQKRLLELIEDPEARVRILAGCAIGNGNFSNEVILNALLPRLKDSDENIRANVIPSIWYRLDNHKLQPIIEATHDESPIVRKEAATALGYTKNRNMIKVLEALLEDKNELVRRGAAYALEELTQSLEQENRNRLQNGTNI